MRNTKLLVIISMLLLALPAMAQRGEKTLGVKTGYITLNKSAVAGVYFDYRFSKHFSLSPNVEYAFRHDGNDAFIFNLDSHFPFSLGSPKVEGYPLVGLTYASWAYHYDDPDLNYDATTRINRFGFNAGLGMGIRATSTLRINIEARLNAVKNHCAGVFTVGIGYNF